MRQPRRKITNITKVMTPAVVPPITVPVLMKGIASERLVAGVGASVMVRIFSIKSPTVSGGHCFHNIRESVGWCQHTIYAILKAKAA